MALPPHITQPRNLLTTSGGGQILGGAYGETDPRYRPVQSDMPSVATSETPQSRRAKATQDDYNRIVHRWAARERRRGGTWDGRRRNVFASAAIKPAVLGGIGYAALMAATTAVEAAP